MHWWRISLLVYTDKLKPLYNSGLQKLTPSTSALLCWAEHIISQVGLPQTLPYTKTYSTLQWRRNGCIGVSNHQPHRCLLNRLFRRRSKKTSKLRVIGLCAGNSPGTSEFPAQRASYAENVYIRWRHHDIRKYIPSTIRKCISKYVYFKKIAYV